MSERIQDKTRDEKSETRIESKLAASQEAALFEDHEPLQFFSSDRYSFQDESETPVK
jgi:hypothetical protein